MSKTNIMRKQLAEAAASLPALVAGLEAELVDVERQMAELQRLGLTHASPHYKAGKYLTLLYPSQAGTKRRRDYVGNDPQKVEEALARIKRARTHDQLSARARRLQEAASSTYGAISEAIRACAGKR
jgi:hypothetical protein